MEKDNHQITSKDENIDFNSSKKEIGKALFYNFIKTYGLIPLNLIITSITARFIIDKTNWGILLYALTFILRPKIIIEFIPPAVDVIMVYKFPEYYVKKDNEKLKGIFTFISYIKLICSIIGFITIFLIGLYQWNSTNLLKYQLIMILSPILILGEFKNLLLRLYTSKKHFKLTSLIVVQEKVIRLVLLVILVFLNKSDIFNLYSLCFINIIAQFSYFPLLGYFFYKEYHKVKKKKSNIREIFSLSKFGIFYSINRSANNFYEQTYLEFLDDLGDPGYITSFNICRNIVNYAVEGVNFSSGPVLAELEEKGRQKELMKLFKETINLTTIIISVIICGVTAFIGSYIRIIYGPEFLDVINFVYIYVIILYFYSIRANFQVILSIKSFEKPNSIINLIGYLILLIGGFLGMRYFAFEGLLFSRVIGYFSISLLYVLFCHFYARKTIQINFIYVFRNLFIIVFILVLTRLTEDFYSFIIINNIILNELVIGCFRFIISMIIFGLYVRYAKILTKKDIEKIKRLNLKIPLKEKIFSLLNKLLLEG